MSGYVKQLPLDYKPTNLMTFCGLRESGKSVQAKYLIAMYHRLFSDVDLHIYDPNDEYHGYGTIEPFVPGDSPSGDTQQTFDGYCSFFRATPGKAVWFIDEAEQYMREGKVFVPDLQYLILRGRHDGKGIVCITQEVQAFSKRFFNRCDWIYIFKCGLKSYNYFGDLLRKEVIDYIIEMEDYCCLAVKVRTREYTCIKYDLKKRKLEYKDLDKMVKTAPVSDDVKGPAGSEDEKV